jgi:hypothetical protein
MRLSQTKNSPAMRQLPDRILVAREAFLTVPELENVIGAQGTGRVKEPRTRNRVPHIAEIEAR